MTDTRCYCRRHHRWPEVIAVSGPCASPSSIWARASIPTCFRSRRRIRPSTRKARSSISTSPTASPKRSRVSWIWPRLRSTTPAPRRPGSTSSASIPTPRSIGSTSPRNSLLLTRIARELCQLLPRHTEAGAFPVEDELPEQVLAGAQDADHVILLVHRDHDVLDAVAEPKGGLHEI